MAKPSNIKLITAQRLGYLISCTILEAHQYFSDYIVKVNAKTICLTLATCLPSFYIMCVKV